MKIIKYNITVGITDISFVRELGNRTKNSKIHIEVDTGMGRTGVNPKNLMGFITEIQKYTNICIDGIYTHLSSFILSCIIL